MVRVYEENGRELQVIPQTEVAVRETNTVGNNLFDAVLGVGTVATYAFAGPAAAGCLGVGILIKGLYSIFGSAQEATSTLYQDLHADLQQVAVRGEHILREGVSEGVGILRNELIPAVRNDVRNGAVALRQEAREVAIFAGRQVSVLNRTLNVCTLTGSTTILASVINTAYKCSERSNQLQCDELQVYIITALAISNMSICMLNSLVLIFRDK